MSVIAVTGATGKSGQYFLKELIKNKSALQESGYSFRFLVRKNSDSSTGNRGRELLSKVDGEIYEADITKPEELDGFFAEMNGEKVDTLFHIASVLLSPYIVPTALKHGVSRLVLVHTTGIYSKYKAAGEQYRKIEEEINRQVNELRQEGKNLSVTYLRPTMIYGDLEDKNISVFINMVYKMRLMPVINGGKYDLQPVWCGDLGKAFYQVLMNPEITADKDYILSGRNPILLIDMFKVIAKGLGVKNIFVSCPFPVAYAGAWVIYLLTVGKIDMREKVQRMVEPRAYPHETATKDFGYNPVCFEEGVQEEIEMYLQSIDG